VFRPGVPDMRRVARCAGVLAAILLAALLSLAVASPAVGAPQDEDVDQSAGSTGSGYVTSVAVVLTGNAAPSGGGGTSLRVPVTCYWASQGMDAVEYKAWYENYKRPSTAPDSAAAAWCGATCPPRRPSTMRSPGRKPAPR
jgi:hypothetical protein